MTLAKGRPIMSHENNGMLLDESSFSSGGGLGKLALGSEEDEDENIITWCLCLLLLVIFMQGGRKFTKVVEL